MLGLAFHQPPKSPVRFLALSVLAIALGAVVLSGPAVAQQGCPSAKPSDGLRLSVGAREKNALIADATVELAEAAPVYLEYGNAQDGWLRTPTTRPGTVHELAMLRLRAATPYEVRAFALDAAGCPSTAATATFTSGELPEQLRSFELRASGRATFPLVLTDIRPPGSDAMWMVAVDQEAQLVWYYPIPSLIDTADSTITIVRLASGNWLYLARSFGFEEITPDGRWERRFPLSKLGGMRPHHDIFQLPDGRILFIAYENRRVDDTANGGPPDRRVRGDTVNVFDPATGSVQRVWAAFDALDPRERPAHWLNKIEDGGYEDWTHMNSVQLGPSGNVIVSIRNLDQVIALSADFATVQWKLGGLDSSFSFPDESDRFWGQHSVTELPGNRILVFDNGTFRPDGDSDYSRALELELDFQTMTARKVWEYRHDPDLFSDRKGNTVRMPSGNTLVNFGYRRAPEEPILLVEAGPDGTAAWQMSQRLPGSRTTRYRAYPFDTLGGEVRVEPTLLRMS